MKKLLRNRWLIVTAILVILIIIGLGLFYKGDQFALNNMTFKQAAPTQLAYAMKQDDFYSSYRENTVIFSGEVTSTTYYGNNIKAFIKTDSVYNLTCEVGRNKVKVGRTYNFAAEAYRAIRQPNGVLLPDCYVF